MGNTSSLSFLGMCACAFCKNLYQFREMPCTCLWHLSLRMSCNCPYQWKNSQIFSIYQLHASLHPLAIIANILCFPSPQTHRRLLQIKLRLFTDHKEHLSLSPVWSLRERQDKTERKRKCCSEMQLICNAARNFGVCMSNASSLHWNMIPRAAHRGNAKWDIKFKDLRNTAQCWTI